MQFKHAQGTVFYKIMGTKGKPWVVFLHGVGMDHQTFLPQVVTLENDYAMVLIDYPSHGKSELLDPSLAFIQTTTTILIACMEALKINDAILIGQSLGSLIAQRIAARNPELVKGLIHIGGAPLYPKHKKSIQGMKLLLPLMTCLTEKQFAKSFAKHKARYINTRAYLEETVKHTGKKVILEVTKDMLNTMVEGLDEPILKPMAMLVGKYDLNYIKRQNSRMFYEQERHLCFIDYYEIEDAHHIANQDNPDAVNEILKSLLTAMNGGESRD